MASLLAYAVTIVCVFSSNMVVGKDLDVSEIRAQEALNGLIDYYWKGDPNHKDVKFFFSCSQTGGLGTSNNGQCSCYNPTSCVNCFRWWNAVALESVATYGIYMNTTNHSTFPDMYYKHSPYNAEWNAADLCTYIDDFLWYGLAYLRVYEWLGGDVWLNRSIALHDWAWEYGWDDPCGGFWWCNCPGRTFKDNIELVQAMHLAAKLAYLLPNQMRFRDSAEKIWNWFFSFDSGGGLFSSTNLVSTGVVPTLCCNSSSHTDAYKQCFNSKLHGTAYNQGLFIGAAAYLYLSTGNKSYLTMGIRVVEAVIANYTTKDGILRDEARSYQVYSYSCYAGSDPGGDWYSFNGIFMLHLGFFTELLVKNGSMPADTLKRINSLIEKTSDSAWLKSAVHPPFDKSNICRTGSESSIKNSTYPKFHWWWGEGNNLSQIIPPDPNIFFHKSQLRCVSLGNNTQLWEGQVKSEDDCRNKCYTNVNCSKYLWQLYEDEVQGLNCWIWPYNRTNHVCNQTNPNWNVGIKRPRGHGTCAGKCGSLEPQILDYGVCYCDTSCSSHMDCCLDYADNCKSSEQLTTCNGSCFSPMAQPILGGGYCWCDAGCTAWFTDNNSDGSCCPDFGAVCYKTTFPQCLDARTQTSALNLFLGHITVARMIKL